MADVTLMTGLPTLAVESYNAAIDQLKSANDWLWLAGILFSFVKFLPWLILFYFRGLRGLRVRCFGGKIWRVSFGFVSKLDVDVVVYSAARADIYAGGNEESSTQSAGFSSQRGVGT